MAPGMLNKQMPNPGAATHVNNVQLSHETHPVTSHDIRYTNAIPPKLLNIRPASQATDEDSKIKIKFKVPKDTLWQMLYWMIFFIQLMIILYYF